MKACVTIGVLLFANRNVIPISETTEEQRHGYKYTIYRSRVNRFFPTPNSIKKTLRYNEIVTDFKKKKESNDNDNKNTDMTQQPIPPGVSH